MYLEKGCLSFFEKKETKNDTRLYSSFKNAVSLNRFDDFESTYDRTTFFIKKIYQSKNLAEAVYTYIYIWFTDYPNDSTADRERYDSLSIARKLIEELWTSDEELEKIFCNQLLRYKNRQTHFEEEFENTQNKVSKEVLDII